MDIRQDREEMADGIAVKPAAVSIPAASATATASAASRRLFGSMLHGTLVSAKASVESAQRSEAAARRAAIEKRLLEKLQRERKEGDKRVQSRELEAQLNMIRHKGERRRTAVQAVKTRLATHQEVWRERRKEVDPPLPIGVKEAREGEDYIFWLPYKLLPVQHDLIENQVREVESWLAEDRAREQKAVELLRRGATQAPDATAAETAVSVGR